MLSNRTGTCRDILVRLIRNNKVVLKGDRNIIQQSIDTSGCELPLHLQ